MVPVWAATSGSSLLVGDRVVGRHPRRRFLWFRAAEERYARD